MLDLVFSKCLFKVFWFLRPYEDESSSSTSDDEYEDGHGYASEPTVGIMDEVITKLKFFQK